MSVVVVPALLIELSLPTRASSLSDDDGLFMSEIRDLRCVNCMGDESSDSLSDAIMLSLLCVAACSSLPSGEASAGGLLSMFMELSLLVEVVVVENGR